jgi:hypothetical protein
MNEPFDLTEEGIKLLCSRPSTFIRLWAFISTTHGDAPRSLATKTTYALEKRGSKARFIASRGACIHPPCADGTVRDV